MRYAPMEKLESLIKKIEFSVEGIKALFVKVDSQKTHHQPVDKLLKTINKSKPKTKTKQKSKK